MLLLFGNSVALQLTVAQPVQKRITHMTEITIDTTQKVHVGATGLPAGSTLPGPLVCSLQSNSGDSTFVLDPDSTGGYIVSADVPGVSIYEFLFVSGSLQLLETVTVTVTSGTGQTSTSLEIVIGTPEPK